MSSTNWHENKKHQDLCKAHDERKRQEDFQENCLSEQHVGYQGLESLLEEAWPGVCAGLGRCHKGTRGCRARQESWCLNG